MTGKGRQIKTAERKERRRQSGKDTESKAQTGVDCRKEAKDETGW